MDCQLNVPSDLRISFTASLRS